MEAVAGVEGDDLHGHVVGAQALGGGLAARGGDVLVLRAGDEHRAKLPQAAGVLVEVEVVGEVARPQDQPIDARRAQARPDAVAAPCEKPSTQRSGRAPASSAKASAEPASSSARASR